MSEYIIPTFTGKLFDLLEPTEDMICIEDIAHHLSIQNRYYGATKFPYSIGYHSILACQVAESGLELEHLLHDAAETYCGDLNPRLKDLVSGYRDIEGQIDDVIGQKFECIQLPSVHNKIKIIDKRLALTEMNQLLVRSLIYPEAENLELYKNIFILKLSAENVEELFLKAYEKWRRD